MRLEGTFNKSSSAKGSKSGTTGATQCSTTVKLSRSTREKTVAATPRSMSRSSAAAAWCLCLTSSTAPCPKSGHFAFHPSGAQLSSPVRSTFRPGQNAHPRHKHVLAHMRWFDRGAPDSLKRASGLAAARQLYEWETSRRVPVPQLIQSFRHYLKLNCIWEIRKM